MRFLFLLILLFPIYLFGQYQLKGKVFDKKTKAPLAFVNIISVSNNLGTTTDIDGRFSIKSDSPLTNLKLSYVGYELTKIDVSNKTKIDIPLNKTSYEIAEFTVFPGINPAERIMKKVIKNRKINNPEKNLNFKYESYNKMYNTILTDSSKIYNTKPDSSKTKILNWLENHHLFMMESVTERKYKLPDKSYEKVLASKVSGVKNASLFILATELQSFTFYNQNMNVLDNVYLNPISENSISKYLFLIEDTTFIDSDTTFIISFRPRKGKNFDALKGLLYINTDGYAIQNVIAEPFEQNEMFSIKIQQQYKKIAGHWFPIQLNSDIIIETSAESNIKSILINQTYLKNVKIDPELSNKEFSNVITEIDKGAGKKDAQFWEDHRNNPLTEKETKTYHTIDSLGRIYNFDNKLKILEALNTGKINWGYIDFNINHLLNYNNYEGIRIGLGLQTSKQLAKWFSVGGYGAYGFKDKTEKYGGLLDFYINKKNDIEFNLSYKKDVKEPGVTNFYDYKNPTLSSAGNRNLYNLNRMNNVEKMEARLKFRTLRYLKTYLFASQENVEITNNYFFKKRIDANTIINDQDYTFNEIGAEFRYAFKEKIVQLNNSKYPISSKYPILYAKIQNGINNFDGEYKYTRVTLRATKKFFIKNLGHPKFYIEAGVIKGRVPQHKLNNSLGSFNPKNRLNISTENAFETMLPYEFLSSEYVHFHFRHSFGSLLFKTRIFEPEIIITSSVGFGDLSYEGTHGGEVFKTMEKGYYESGLVIHNILRYSYITMGVGVFYRYGPYQLENTKDNIAAKLSLGLVIPKKTAKKSFL